MATADYSFYTGTYHGNAINSTDFARLVTRAGSYLNSVKAVETLPDTEAVNMALCAVAEVWQQNEQGGEVSSQSVGGWSQSFVASNKSAKLRLYEAAEMYIPNLISRVRWI